MLQKALCIAIININTLIIIGFGEYVFKRDKEKQENVGALIEIH